MAEAEKGGLFVLDAIYKLNQLKPRTFATPLLFVLRGHSPSRSYDTGDPRVRKKVKETRLITFSLPKLQQKRTRKNERKGTNLQAIGLSGSHYKRLSFSDFDVSFIVAVATRTQQNVHITKIQTKPG